jgi:hypothetical protein
MELQQLIIKYVILITDGNTGKDLLMPMNLTIDYVVIGIEGIHSARLLREIMMSFNIAKEMMSLIFRANF